MKKIYLFALMLFSVIASMAQPTPVDVEPGVKGPLPTVASIDKTVPVNQWSDYAVKNIETLMTKLKGENILLEDFT